VNTTVIIKMVNTHNKQSKAIDNVFNILSKYLACIILCSVKILCTEILANKTVYNGENNINNTLCNGKQRHKQHKIIVSAKKSILTLKI
jgi:hypothetical protein